MSEQRTPARNGTADDARGALRAELVAAMKSGRRDDVATLRTAIATLDNAEAIRPPDRDPSSASAHVAGASAGVGSSDVERRTLTTRDVRRILTDLIAELITDADQLDALGRRDDASKLRNSATLLLTHVPDASG
jgi:hypothetical protein